jgi:hypothetical protein
MMVNRFATIVKRGAVAALFVVAMTATANAAQTVTFSPASSEGGTAKAAAATVQGRVVPQQMAIPEPATMMLLGTGLLAAFRARRPRPVPTRAANAGLIWLRAAGSRS